MKKLLSLVLIMFSTFIPQAKANQVISSLQKFVSLYIPKKQVKNNNFGIFNCSNQFSSMRFFWTSNLIYSHLFTTQKLMNISEKKFGNSTHQNEEFISDIDKETIAVAFIEKALSKHKSTFTYNRKKGIFEHKYIVDEAYQLSSDDINDIKKQIILGELQLTYPNQKQFIAYHLKELCDSIKWVKKLELEGRNIKKLPKNLVQMSNLRFLNLSGNVIEKLPDNFHELLRLEYLDLSSNNLHEFPKNLCHLTTLKKLIMFKNHIKTVPRDIKELSNLQYLNLSWNKLRTLPHEIGALEQLETFWLCRNNLGSLPESIGNLAHLRRINLSYNEKLQLPESFLELKKSLEEILLSETNLKKSNKKLQTYFCEIQENGDSPSYVIAKQLFRKNIDYDDLGNVFYQYPDEEKCFYAKKE